MAEQPHLGSMRPGPALGAVLYGLLALALAISLLGDRLAFLPPQLLSAAPIAFALFLVVFVLYRFVLIRAGRYSFGRALFQVGAGVLFLAVLFQRPHLAAPSAASDDLPALLANPDPLVRQLACELARYRPDGKAALALVREHAQSDVPAVRESCAKTVQLLGP